MGDNREIENPLIEAHFCGLQSQSNVYGLCKIDLANKPSEILVSSLKGKTVSLKFAKNKPLSREVRFTYIPGDAEIISIDAFNKFQHGNKVVVGISFIKVLNGKTCSYLNVYSEWEQSVDFNLDSIAQGWHNIELNFTPYQLSHTVFVHEGNVEVIFLLSGSDARVHMFREDKYLQLFNEVSDCEIYFPEFADLPSNVTWLQCEYYQDYQKRVTAIGFFNGMIKIAVVNTQSLEVISSWITEHDSPITSLKLFTLKSDVECPHFVTEVMDSLEDPMEYSTQEYNVLVNSAIEASVVYRNVLVSGFSCPLTLQDSEQYDCALCGCVADVDLDGYNEVIIGTYGQEMLVYKFTPDKKLDQTNKSDFVLQQSGTTGKRDNSDETNSICPATKTSPCTSRPLSLNLSEEPSQDITDSSATVQSPLNFHSGHFNSDMTLTGNEESNIIADTETENKVEKCKEIHSELDQKVNLSDDVKKLENITSVKCNTDHDTQDHQCQDFLNASSTKSSEKILPGKFELLWKQSFTEPVFAIGSLDTTGDGLEELVVLTQKGIHILQHDINKAAELCLQRLKQATFHQGPSEDVFKQLLSENLLGSYHEDSNTEDASLS